MDILALLLAALLGGGVYRARGAGLWPGRPWWQIAFALPYATAAFGAGGAAGGLAVLILTSCAVLTGHASYMDLGVQSPGSPYAPKDGKADEWYGGWIPGRGYWHDFAGLAVSGLLISLPAGAFLMLDGDVAHGLGVALSGGLKAPAYALGRFAPGADPVPAGEALCGAALWFALRVLTA